MPTEPKRYRRPADYPAPIRRMHDRNGVVGDRECHQCQWLTLASEDGVITRSCFLDTTGAQWNPRWTACGMFAARTEEHHA